MNTSLQRMAAPIDKLVAHQAVYPLIKIRNGEKYFFRFTIHQRIQHGILAILVLILVITGMPLKFHDAFWSQPIYRLVGGIHMAPAIHRAAGVVMICFFIYHLVYMARLLLTQFRRRFNDQESISGRAVLDFFLSRPLMPSIRDVKEIIALMKYYLFLTETRPQGGQWTWKDKFDYWAPFWGIPVLGITGLMMWGQELTTRFLPGEILNYALIAHSDEALLAALFLLIWHMYNVHFCVAVFPMGSAFLTGYLNERIMVEEHYEYYVEVMKASGLENEILAPHANQTCHETEKEPAV